MAGLIKLSKEQKAALALKVQDMLDAAVAEKARIEARWRKQRDQYDNIPTPFVQYVMKGVQDKCYPFTQPLADTLADNVSVAIFSQDPVVSISSNGMHETDVKASEDCLKFLHQRGRLESAVRTLMDDTFVTNHGVLRLVLDRDEMLFKYEPIPVEDVLVLGSACYNLETADMVGHWFYPTVGEVLDRIDAGEYYAQDDAYRPRPEEHDAKESDTSMVDPTQVADEENRPTKLACLSMTCDLSAVGKPDDGKKRKRGKVDTYLVHYDVTARVILSCRPAPSRRHWYFSFGYLPRPSRGFWSSKSVAKNLQDLHDAYQMANNILLYGHLWSAFKPIISKGPFAKGQSLSPGGYITTMGGEATMPNLDFDPAQLPFVIQNLEKVGQSTVRISQAGMAKPTTTSKTATQVEDEAQGQAIGRSGYVACFSEALQEMSREELLTVQALWKEFKEAHGAALPDGPAPTAMPVLPEGMPGEDAPVPPSSVYPFGDVRDVDLDITGSSPAMSPQFQYARAMSLLQMAPNYPEINQREVLETVISALQLRNASKILYTPEEMRAMAQQAHQQQLQLAMAQAAMGGGAGGPAAEGGQQPPAEDELAPGSPGEQGLLDGLNGVQGGV